MTISFFLIKPTHGETEVQKRIGIITSNCGGYVNQTINGMKYIFYAREWKQILALSAFFSSLFTVCHRRLQLKLLFEIIVNNHR